VEERHNGWGFKWIYPFIATLGYLVHPSCARHDCCRGSLSAYAWTFFDGLYSSAAGFLARRLESRLPRLLFRRDLVRLQPFSSSLELRRVNLVGINDRQRLSLTFDPNGWIAVLENTVSPVVEVDSGFYWPFGISNCPWHSRHDLFQRPRSFLPTWSPLNGTRITRARYYRGTIAFRSHEWR